MASSFRSSRSLAAPSSPSREDIENMVPGLVEEDGEEDGGMGDEDKELFIDLEKLLELHRSVRIKIPAQTASIETTSEEGTRELVITKGEQDGGVVV